MINKNRVLIIIFFTLLVVYIFSYKFIYLAKKKTHPLVNVDWAKIESIEIKDGNEKTVIKRDGDQYVFVTPYEGIVVNNKSMQIFFKVFGKLSVKKSFGNVDEKLLDGFGVNKYAPVINIKIEGKDIQLILGTRSPVAEQDYVYIKDKGLFLTDRFAETIFLSRPKDFRERRLIKFDDDEITTVDIIRKNNQNISLNKETGDWYLKFGSKSYKYLCDNKQVKAFLGKFIRLEVTDFEPLDSNFSIPRCGLTNPQVSMTVVAGTSSVRAIDFGSIYDGDKVYVSADKKVAGGALYSFVNELPAPTTAFARIDIIDFPLPLVSKFTTKGSEDLIYKYEKRRGRWYQTERKEREIEEEKIYEFFAILSNIKIDKFFFDNVFGDIKKEYVFYTKKGDIILDIQIGESVNGYTRLRFKNKEGIFGVSNELVNLLKL